MRAERFRAQITAGQRGHGVITVPFDPDEVWGGKVVHHVAGTVNRAARIAEVVGLLAGGIKERPRPPRQ